MVTVRRLQEAEARMRRHVLVIDPWPEICGVIQLALEADGSYRVTSAGTAPAAAIVLAADRPDLAIIDVVLPQVSGLTLASEAVDRGVPVLLMTAEPGTELKLEHAGCPFLKKPFHLEELRASVKTLLNETAQKRAQMTALLPQLMVAAE
jgi:DNA-binding response OmpR family regulator